MFDKDVLQYFVFSLVPTNDEIAALPYFRRDQLVLCKFLGSGAFGEVFEGVDKNILNENSGETSCAVRVLYDSFTFYMPIGDGTYYGVTLGVWAGKRAGRQTGGVQLLVRA